MTKSLLTLLKPWSFPLLFGIQNYCEKTSHRVHWSIKKKTNRADWRCPWSRKQTRKWSKEWKNHSWNHEHSKCSLFKGYSSEHVLLLKNRMYPPPTFSSGKKGWWLIWRLVEISLILIIQNSSSNLNSKSYYLGLQVIYNLYNL